MFAFYVIVLTAALYVAGACHPGASYPNSAIADYEDEHLEFNGSHSHRFIADEVATDDTANATTITTSIVTEVEYEDIIETTTTMMHHHKLPKEQFKERPQELPPFYGMNPRESETRHTHPAKCHRCAPQHLQYRYCHSDFVIQGRIASSSFNATLTNTSQAFLQHLKNITAQSNQTWHTEDAINYNTSQDPLEHHQHTKESDSEDQNSMSPQNASLSSMYITLERILKGSHQLTRHHQHHGIVQVHFNAASAGCHGKELKEETSYLIMGHISNGKLHLGQCEWPLATSKLTSSQRYGLKHLYRRYCMHCKVDTQILPPDPWSTNSYSQTCVYNPTMYSQWGQEDCEGDYSVCVKTNTQTCHWLKNSQMRACAERRDNQDGGGLGMPPAPAWVVPDPN